MPAYTHFYLKRSQVSCLVFSPCQKGTAKTNTITTRLSESYGTGGWGEGGGGGGGGGDSFFDTEYHFVSWCKQFYNAFPSVKLMNLMNYCLNAKKL